MESSIENRTLSASRTEVVTKMEPHIPLPSRVPDGGDELPADDDITFAAAEDEARQLNVETHRRLWVQTITPFLQLRSHDTDPSPRVQLASDKAWIAAYEALGRLMDQVAPRDVET
jgi:hypothetical protein